MALVITACLTLGIAAGLLRGLTGCAPTTTPTPRPLSPAEAHRLAQVRLGNYTTGRAGLRVQFGRGSGQSRFAGWVDWRQSLAYLAVTGPAPSGDGLVQAVPGVIATRPANAGTPGSPLAAPTPATAPTAAPSASSTVTVVTAATAATSQTPSGAPAQRQASARPSATTPPGALAQGRTPATTPPGAPAQGRTPATTPPEAPTQRRAPAVTTTPRGEPAKPPVTAPADRWRTRAAVAPTGANAPLDTLMALLFTISSSRPDDATLLAATDARWLAKDTVGRVPVDVLLGPAVPPQKRPATGALATMGGAVRYWVDADGVLLRFEALLGADWPVRVELDRSEQPAIQALPELGGAPIAPRKATAKEAAMLAGMAERNRDRAGGRVTLSVPTPGEKPVTGAGWLDWRRTVAYLSVKPPAALMLADGAGVRLRPAPKAGATLPPLPAPRSGWRFAPWQSRRDTRGAFDLDLLVNQALAAGGRAFAAPGRAVWLRSDMVGKTRVTVYEVPDVAERAEPGRARLRYWVDASGGLRRLELRTRTGAFAQLTITPGAPPSLR